MPTSGRRRWPWVAGGSLLVLLGAGGWYHWLPEQRPDLADGERYGIDVSHHQGDIDWEPVAGDGIEFAYLKATEGGDHVDRAFEASWVEAGEVGIDRGAYHFFTLCTPGAAQAEHFLATVPDGGELPPALDLELAGNCSERPPSALVRAEVDAFVARVEEATGDEVLLYVGQDFADRYGSRSTYDGPRWIQRFWQRPSEDWAVWQVTYFAHVEGIEGLVDLDIGRLPLG
jgi:lysozyme